MILLNGEEIKFKRFPNNETRMEINKQMIKSTNQVSFKYENDSDLIKLMFVKKYLDNNSTVENKLVLYYMPYSRMDRKEGDSVFTLKYVSDFINKLKFNEVKVIEPHSDVTAALLENVKTNYINFKLLPLVLKDVEFNKNIDYLFFPDAGAQKRYHSLKGFKLLVGYKNRDFQTGEIKSLEVVGDVPTNARKIVIVDDLTSYGGTFLHSGNKLKELGFKEIYLLVAHAENSVFKGELLKEGSPIDKIFTTNSIITENNYWENLKFKDRLTIYEVEELVND